MFVVSVVPMGFFGSWLGQQPRWVGYSVFGAVFAVIVYALIRSGAWWLLPLVILFAGAIYVRVRDASR